MVTVGIDYSLSSPAVCVALDDTFALDSCKFYYLTSKKKYDDTYRNCSIIGELHREWSTPEERYHNISSWALSIVRQYEPQQITIEDYAMGAKGRVFHIGENAGILKYRLWKNNDYVRVISPSEVKKYATGKGNAKKEQMFEAFLNEHKYNIMDDMGQKTLDNPVTDIIDSYYICKAGIHAISR